MLSFLITALVWFVRFIAVLQLKAGFAFEGGTFNAILFASLLILSILRFMIFGGLAIELLEIKKIVPNQIIRIIHSKGVVVIYCWVRLRLIIIFQQSP